jgi:hypothetical protein
VRRLRRRPPLDPAAKTPRTPGWGGEFFPRWGEFFLGGEVGVPEPGIRHS